MKTECVEEIDGETRTKRKTAFIMQKLEEKDYKRQIMDPISKLNKSEAKTIIMARFGMLECGFNFKGTLPVLCPLCNQTDDENHRLNVCKRWETSNLFSNQQKSDFGDVYSSDINTLRDIMNKITRVWNVVTGKGGMH